MIERRFHTCTSSYMHRRVIITGFITFVFYTAYVVMVPFNTDFHKYVYLYDSRHSFPRSQSTQPKRLRTMKPKSLLDQGHSHFIPNRLILTYKRDLRRNDTNISLTEEETVLRDNVEYMTALARGVEVDFFTDERCVEVIRRYDAMFFSPKRPLSVLFSHTPRGMIKADICRGAALFFGGGWYIDVDVRPLCDFRVLSSRGNMLNNTIITVTPAWEKESAIFQAIIGATTRNQVIGDYLELFSKISLDAYNQDANIGTYMMYEAVKRHSSQVHLLTEARLVDYPGGHVEKRSGCNSMLRGGNGYWCDNVVFDTTDNNSVWFQSRVPGTRMCIYSKKTK